MVLGVHRLGLVSRLEDELDLGISHRAIQMQIIVFIRQGLDSLRSNTDPSSSLQIPLCLTQVSDLQRLFRAHHLRVCEKKINIVQRLANSLDV